MREAGLWFTSLPLNHFSEALLKIPVELAIEYLETMLCAYKALGRLEDDTDRGFGGVTVGRLVSAIWARDPDIMRLHKSMPHWQRMRLSAAAAALHPSVNGDKAKELTGMTDSLIGNDLKLSGEEQATLWTKEAHSLLQNMRQEGLTEQDTVVDKSHLRLVAHLHESTVSDGSSVCC